MTVQPSLAEMLKPREKGLLRFLTCGSVDDGKSTLIGRLLYDSKLIFEDQLATLEKDSQRHGTTGEDIDFALLVDGLEAEREQGITIDVAYRFFSTAKRSFIVADTPGHEQYTRNMATGASTADLAVLMIDARKGVLVQTKRHATICSLLGIRHIVVAVNKIDLVGWDRAVFDRIVGDFAGFAADLGFSSIVPIPISARFGDNVTDPLRQHGLVSRTEPRRASGDRRCRERPRQEAVSLSGAVGQPPESRFSRLCRHGRLGLDPAGRRRHRRRVGQDLDRQRASSPRMAISPRRGPATP